MKRLKRLLRLAAADGVRVFWKVLPHPFRGVYSNVRGRAHVSLHQRLAEAEARCVLAHELGHHVCRAVYPVATRFRGRAHDRAERQADGFAVAILAQLARRGRGRR